MFVNGKGKLVKLSKFVFEQWAMIFLLRKLFSYSVIFVKTGLQPILNNISRLRGMELLEMVTRKELLYLKSPRTQVQEHKSKF